MHPISRRLVRNLLVVAAVVALAVPAWATITDDINPFGNIVQVTLSNPSGETVSGTVHVTAELEHSWGPVPASEPYVIGPYDQIKVDVVFGDEVKDVLSVAPVDEK